MPQASQPLPYTASPYLLALSDLLLWVRITFVWPPWAGIPSIVLPIFPFHSGPLDELYPSPSNLYSLIVQLILTTLQALFLATLPISATLGIGFPLLPPIVGAYVPIWLSWVAGFILLNCLSSIFLLNGLTREFMSKVPLSGSEISDHQHEKWVFVNGVAAGSHWLQSNLDRLSLTFRREIYGIHNQTRGILFDLIECILERTFSYPTPSTRIVYQRLLDIVSDERYTKIVLILHSQGAIEGGLALDWLFATVPAPQLARVEVYTFGSAANHFNNPIATTTDQLGRRIDLPSNGDGNSDFDNAGKNGYDGGGGSDTFQQGRVLQHIEHYANSGDYVAKFGILNFRPLPLSVRCHIFGPFWSHGYWRTPAAAAIGSLSSPTATVMTTLTRGDDDDDVSDSKSDLESNEQTIVNRYVGRLFIRPGTGHQLNGNYLDNFFRLNKTLFTVIDDDDDDDDRSLFMNNTINFSLFKQDDIVVVDTAIGAETASVSMKKPQDTISDNNGNDNDKNKSSRRTQTKVKVKDVSRLWMYRNGKSPIDDAMML